MARIKVVVRKSTFGHAPRKTLPFLRHVPEDIKLDRNPKSPNNAISPKVQEENVSQKTSSELNKATSPKVQEENVSQKSSSETTCDL